MFDVAHEFGRTRRTKGEEAISSASHGQRWPLFLTSFAEAVRRHPDRLAVSHGPRVLTYQELDRRAGTWAARFRAWGIGKGSMVAVCIPSSLDAVVAALAVFKAGAIYVPVDPNRPAATVDATLDVIRPRLVLTGPLHGASAGHMAARDGSAIAATSAVSRSVNEAPVGEPSDDDVAYALYVPALDGSFARTSATQATLAVRLAAARAAYGFAPHHVLCCQGSSTSEPGLLEVLSALTSGASLRLRDLRHDSRALAGAVVRALASSTMLARPLRRTTSMVRRSARHAAGGPQHRPTVTVPLHVSQRGELSSARRSPSASREIRDAASLGRRPGVRAGETLRETAGFPGMLRRPRLSGVAKLLLRVLGRTDQSVPRREVSA